MLSKPLYQHIASAIDAMHRCDKEGNQEWGARHRATLNHIADNLLPSGSGIDNGTTIDWSKSTGEKIVLSAGFHHMNDGGCYDGWTEHEIIITASLMFTINLRITGRNRNDIKDYLNDVYDQALTTEYDHSYDKELDTDSFKEVTK